MNANLLENLSVLEGKNYKFKTGIYKSGEKTYLKVGADPLFGYEDLYSLVSQYKNRNSGAIKNFVIDVRNFLIF